MLSFKYIHFCKSLEKTIQNFYYTSVSNIYTFSKLPVDNGSLFRLGYDVTIASVIKLARNYL